MNSVARLSRNKHPGHCALGLLGFDADEWVVPVEICGVAAMYEKALNARTAYFIS